MISLTQRGNAAVAVCVALAFCAVIFEDVLILSAFFVALSLIAEELIWARTISRRPTKWFKTRPESLSETARIGESVSSAVYVSNELSTGSAILSLPDLDFASIHPSVLRGGEGDLKATVNFKSPFSGKYEAKSLAISLSSPLRIFSAYCKIPLSIEYRVVPRILEVAAETSRLLGRAGIGEIPLQMPGIGTEFYELREYVSGDPYSHINWKASARTGELHVNESMREAPGSYYLILDANAPDYFDRDRIASSFLQLANAIFKLGGRFGLVVHDGRRILSQRRVSSPEVSLRAALDAALQFTGIERIDSELELSPIPIGRLQLSQQLLRAGGFGSLSLMETSAQAGMKQAVEVGVFGSITEQLELESQEGGTFGVLYASGLFHSLVEVVQLGTELAYRGIKFSVVNPAMPWISAQGLNDSYSRYEDWEKSLRILRYAGIPYYVDEPIEIVRKVL